MFLGTLRRVVTFSIAGFVAISISNVATAQAQTSAPTVYNAASDRNAHPKPAVPSIGGAGSTFTDPTYGSRMMRVTDPNTRPGTTGRSYTTPSAAHQTAWNANSTYFYVRSVDGYFVPYSFNASAMSISRVQATGSGNGGLLINSQAEPQFSFVSPNIIYVTRQDSTYDWPVIQQMDLSSGAYTDLINLGESAPIAHSTYTGGLASSAGSPERVMAFFGGTAQDSHYLVAVFDVNQPRAVKVLNTTSSTVTVSDQKSATNIPLNFHIHHAFLDRTGQYVILETTAVDRPAHAPLYVWDLSANSFTALPESGGLAGGHYATGFGAMVNQDCCTSTTWDSAQWQFRALATPTANHDVVPVLTPQETYAGDHPSWNNAQNGALVPFVTAYYRSASETSPWRAWDDEIIAVQTSAGAAGATVWRFAHHRTNIVSFWDTPRANVSQDGRWAIFTSNWEKTLGTDPGGGPREDVFMVELSGGAASTPSPTPTPTPTPTPAPTPTPTPSPAPTPTPTPTPAPTPTPTPGSSATWSALVNTTANGNSLQKTGGCGGCGDAEAVSQQQIASGDGYVEFTASETGTLRFIGFGSGTVGAGAAAIQFGFRLQGGTAEVRESGTYKTDTPFATGDVFRIAVVGGTVKYSKNGSVFYTSGTPLYPLKVDAVFYDLNATINNVTIGTGVSTPASVPASAPVRGRHGPTSGVAVPRPRG